MAETVAGSDASDQVLDVLKNVTHDGNVHVKRQLASTLGQFGPAGVKQLAELIKDDSKDKLLIDLAISGTADEEANLFAALPEGHAARNLLIEVLVKRNQGDEIEKLLASLSSSSEFKAVAKSAVTNRRTPLVISLLDLAAVDSTDKGSREAIIKGLIDGGKKKGFKKLPVKEMHPLLAMEKAPDGISSAGVKDVTKLFDLGSGEEVVYLKTEADKEQYKLGETHYQRICLGCHQIHGKGQQFLAPPLVDSEWVSGPKKRLVATVLDGLQGPITVAGKEYKLPEIQPLMPGLRLNPEFTDEQLAAIMTYVRNAWGNGGTPVSTKEVTDYRNSTEARAPWTATEARKIK